MSESQRAIRPPITGLSTQLRIALLTAVLLAYGAWIVQWMAEFPLRSIGASATAVAFAVGLILAMIVTPFAIYSLIRTPSSRTGASYALSGICFVPLLVALFAGFTLVAGGD